MAEGKCPFAKAAAGGGTTNVDWWPNQLKLNILRQHSSISNPMNKNFNYAAEFSSVNLDELKRDIAKVSFF